MKELNEIIERLDSQDEVIENLVKLAAQLEKREVKFPEIHIPNYSGLLEELKARVESGIEEFDRFAENLKVRCQQQNQEYRAQMQQLLLEVKDIVPQIPKAIPVKHQHHFDLKTKGWIISGAMLLIVVAIATGYCFYLFSENRRLKANDLKFRMVRQAYPIQANWANAAYEKDPEAMRKLTEKLENETKEPTAEKAGQKKRKSKRSKRKAVIAPQSQS